MSGGYDGRNGYPVPQARQDYRIATASQTTSLAELLERVLDKGIVIAGDITVSLAEVQLLTIRVRLLIASIDKAQEIGINWWLSDPTLSSRARQLEEENRLLRERLSRLETRMGIPQPVPVPVQASAATDPWNRDDRAPNRTGARDH